MIEGKHLLSRRQAVGSGVAMAFGVAGCLSGEDGRVNRSDGTAVNGSFFVLYDLARQVAGDELSVEDLVPIGAHGDDWEPSPGIIEEIAEADIFVYIDGFRGWSDAVARSLPSDYPEVTVIDAADGIDYISGESGRGEDPHFWLDPVLAREAVENIRAGFIEADPDNASVYESNAGEYIERLDEVHRQFVEAMDHRQKDTLVIGSHDSFQYWTQRYELSIYSPVGISPDGEPTAREMEEVTTIINEHGLGYILYDMYEGMNYAESLQEETGTELLPLSPIEATTEEQLEQDMGYVEHMLEINLETVRQALEVSDA